METTQAQTETKRQDLICYLWGGVLQNQQEWVGLRETTQILSRRSWQLYTIACSPCSSVWLQGCDHNSWWHRFSGAHPRFEQRHPMPTLTKMWHTVRQGSLTSPNFANHLAIVFLVPWLIGMYSPAVTLLVHLQDVGKLEPLNWWNQTGHTKKPSLNLAMLGICLMSCSRSCKKSHAACMYTPHTLQMSIFFGTNFSAPDVVR